MNVIRMIKLFGWEPKVADQLAGKREDELKYIWKYKVLELVNGNIKYAGLYFYVHEFNLTMCVAMPSPSSPWLPPSLHT